jgi:hypothetical protein
MKHLLITAAFAILYPLAAFSQVVEVKCPATLICLTQSEANIAASKLRELDATKEKVTALEDALKLKDATIAELKTTAAKNESDLKDAIKRTELELGFTKGQLTAREAEVVRQSAIITAMIPMLRRKSNGIINF